MTYGHLLIWSMTQKFDSFVIDQQGHPSMLGNAFLYYSFQLGDGETAYSLVLKRYKEVTSALFCNSLSSQSSVISDGVHVIEGKRGHLFLDGDSNRLMDQHYGRIKQSPSELSAIERLLLSRKMWMEDHGIEFITLVVPDKNFVYFDKLPNPIPADLERPGLKYVELAQKVGVSIIYPLKELQSAYHQGVDVFDATDTHWNYMGGFLAYKILMAELVNRNLNVRVVSEKDLICQHPFRQGDLGNKMTPPRSAITTKCTVVDARSILIFDNDNDNAGHINNRGRIKIYECDTGITATAIIFGDSFHIAMLPYLAESFRRLIFVHRSDLDYKLIEQEKPDVVIVESVERFLISLPPEHRRTSTVEIISEKYRRMDAVQRKSALDSIYNARDIFKNAPEFYFQLGLILLYTNEFIASVEAFSNALKFRAEWMQAREYRCLALYESGQFEMAFEESSSLDLPNPISLNEQNALNASNKCSGWAYPRHHLGQIYLIAKEFTKAEKHQRKAVELTPEDPNVWFRLGQILGIQNRLEEEAFSYREAIKLNNFFLVGWISLGQNSLKRFDAIEAMSAFETALSISPNDSEIYTFLGVALSRNNDISRAEESFLEAIRIKPSNYKAHIQLGVVLKKQGKLDNAIAAFQNGLAHNPENSGGIFELSETLVRQGSFQEAEMTLVGNSRHHYSLNINMQLLLARIYFHQKKYEESKGVLIDILTHTPDQIQAQQQLATINRLIETDSPT